MADLTYDELARVLKYDSESGKLFWLPRPMEMFKSRRSWLSWNTQHAGKEALRGTPDRYGSGIVLGRVVRAHRAAWTLHYKQPPPEIIDHINGIQNDNRIINMRNASSRQNAQNAKLSARNTSGYAGVSWCARANRWRVKMGDKFVGYFFDKQEAIEARKAVAGLCGYTQRNVVQP